MGILFSGFAEVDDAAAFLLEKAFESVADPTRLRKTVHYWASYWVSGCVSEPCELDVRYCEPV